MTAGSPKLIVRDYDARRDPLDRRSIPYQLHVSQHETEKRSHDPAARANHRFIGGTIGTFAGGFRFSPAMREYLIPVLPASVAAYRSGWSVWWRNPYLVSRLRVRMGDVSVDALIEVRRDHRDWNAVAAAVEKSLPWLIRRDQLAFKLAREYYRSPQAGPIEKTGA